MEMILSGFSWRTVGLIEFLGIVFVEDEWPIIEALC